MTRRRLFEATEDQQDASDTMLIFSRRVLKLAKLSRRGRWVFVVLLVLAFLSTMAKFALQLNAFQELRMGERIGFIRRPSTTLPQNMVSEGDEGYNATPKQTSSRSDCYSMLNHVHMHPLSSLYTLLNETHIPFYVFGFETHAIDLGLFRCVFFLFGVSFFQLPEIVIPFFI